MPADQKQKQQFFDLAVARGYLTHDVVEQWGFLSLEEFWHNGYISKDCYRELLGEVLGEEPPVEEVDASDLSDRQIPDEVYPVSRGPVWQARMKFTGLDVPAAATQENKGPVKIEPDEPKPLKLSVKSLKERQKQVKKTFARVDGYEEGKPPDTPAVPGLDYDPEQEATERVEWYRNIQRQLHRRTLRELAKHLQYTVLTCGLALVFLNLFYLCSISHLLLCAAIGSAAGFILHRFRGEYSTLIFAAAFVSNIIGGEAVGAEIFANMFSSIAGAVTFALLAGSFLLYITLGRALGDAIRSTYFNYY